MPSSSRGTWHTAISVRPGVFSRAGTQIENADAFTASVYSFAQARECCASQVIGIAQEPDGTELQVSLAPTVEPHRFYCHALVGTRPRSCIPEYLGNGSTSEEWVILHEPSRAEDKARSHVSLEARRVSVRDRGDEKTNHGGAFRRRTSVRCSAPKSACQPQRSLDSVLDAADPIVFRNYRERNA